MQKFVLIFLGSVSAASCAICCKDRFSGFRDLLFLQELWPSMSSYALIGFLTALFTGPYLIRQQYRIGVTVGILSGFTTFSTVGLETFALANDREFSLASLNVSLSCGLGFVAVWLGFRTAETLF